MAESHSGKNVEHWITNRHQSGRLVRSLAPLGIKKRTTNHQLLNYYNYQMSSPNLFIYLHQFLVGYLGLAAGKFQTNGRLS